MENGEGNKLTGVPVSKGWSNARFVVATIRLGIFLVTASLFFTEHEDAWITHAAPASRLHFDGSSNADGSDGKPVSPEDEEIPEVERVLTMSAVGKELSERPDKENDAAMVTLKDILKTVLTESNFQPRETHGAPRVPSEQNATVPLEVEKNKKQSPHRADNERHWLAGAEWFQEVANKTAKSLVSMFEDGFREWLKKQKPANKKKRSCQATKLEGRTPSAANGDSPLLTFGYPNFDEESGMTVLNARISLSTVNGFLAPVHVGAEDYYVQGTYDELIEFFDCFSDYDVVASKMLPNGHWTKEEGHGPLYVQVQNARHGVQSPVGPPAQLLFRYGVDSLKKAVRVGATLHGFLPGSFDDVQQMAAIAAMLGEFMPGSSPDELIDLCVQVAQTSDKRKQAALIVEGIEQALSRKRLDPRVGWEDTDTVDLTAPLTVMLTSYPRPAHGVRATLELPSNTVRLGDLKDKFVILFEKSLLGRTLEAMHGTS
ncbi:UNVERIFIED_CONTAM: hypothetical protein HHA_222188 [Hammondia hammondi]|eukprot:XP_008886211.1 hypothetical protein HHA_222188 [Hammondia hammondi]